MQTAINIIIKKTCQKFVELLSLSQSEGKTIEIALAGYFQSVIESEGKKPGIKDTR